MSVKAHHFAATGIRRSPWKIGAARKPRPSSIAIQFARPLLIGATKQQD
jgi:hypothetical protein